VKSYFHHRTLVTECQTILDLLQREVTNVQRSRQITTTHIPTLSCTQASSLAQQTASEH